MVHVSPSKRPPREYEAFLSTSIGEQENGTPVSLLSALIRSDYDPWEQAARLAKLPPDRAQWLLVGLLNKLLGRSCGFAECENLAKKLLQLLPTQMCSRPLTLQSMRPSGGLPLLAYWLIWVGFVLLLSLVQPHGHRSGQSERSTEGTSQSWRLDNSDTKELTLFGIKKTSFRPPLPIVPMSSERSEAPSSPTAVRKGT